MSEYVVSLISFQMATIEVVPKILATPTMSDLLFPATLPVAPEREITIPTFREFNLALVPSGFSNEEVATVLLYSHNGIEFDAIIKPNVSVIPNIVTLKFATSHLTNGIVTLRVLVSLITELVPVFNVEHAAVWEPLSDSGKYFNGPNSKHYPMSISWVTYFGRELYKFLGAERFSHLNACKEKIEIDGGIILILETDPALLDSVEYHWREKQALKELDLMQFEKRGL